MEVEFFTVEELIGEVVLFVGRDGLDWIGGSLEGELVGEIELFAGRSLGGELVGEVELFVGGLLEGELVGEVELFAGVIEQEQWQDALSRRRQEQLHSW